MVVRDRTQGEQDILDASEAILDLMGDDRSMEFDPTNLVLQVAKTHDRYSARAALLHLLETGALALSSNWNVKLGKSAP
jgi:hypothetical protein